jgi:uncharacterized Zn-binding protein involved in type VI secretion
MPGQGRLGDKANVPLDAHGCPACPHSAVGPAIMGSPDVNVNRRPALRVDDPGIHAACCGSNTWKATQGSATVMINGKAAHRMGDQNRHCGGTGQLIEGSPNVIVGEATSAGAGASAGAAALARSAGGGASAASSTSSGAGAGNNARAAGGATGGGAGAGSSAAGGAGGASSAARSAASGRVSGGASSSTGGPPGAPGSPSPAPAPPEPAPEPTFVEIVLVGEDLRPVAGERYLLTTPDGVVHDGVLGTTGSIKVWTTVAGDCTLEFPDLDRDAWGRIDG